MWYMYELSPELFIGPLALWSILIIIAITCIIKSPVYRSPIVYVTMIVAIFALPCFIMSGVTAYRTDRYDFVVIPNEILSLIHSSLVALPGLMTYQRINKRSKEPDTWIIYLSYVWGVFLILYGIVYIGVENEMYHDHRDYGTSHMLTFIKCGNCAFVMSLLLFVALHCNTLSSEKAKTSLIFSTLLYVISIFVNLVVFWVNENAPIEGVTEYIILMAFSEVPMVVSLLLTVLFSHLWELEQPSLKKKLKTKSTKTEV